MGLMEFVRDCLIKKLKSSEKFFLLSRFVRPFHERMKKTVNIRLCSFITAEGAGFVNLEQKKILQLGKTGFIMLNTGKAVFSLLRRRLVPKNKKQKEQRKTKTIHKSHQQSRSEFIFAKKGVFRRAKIGFRALLMIKERYF